MNNYRIGRDIYFSWKVKTAGKDENLEGADLKLYMLDPNDCAIPVKFEVEGNTLKWAFFGAHQRHVGTYRLELHKNHGKLGMYILDRPKLFRLVGSTQEEKIDDATLEGETEILSEDNMLLGVTGVSISKIEQTVISEESGGLNEVTLTLTDGTKHSFNFRNGERGYLKLEGILNLTSRSCISELGSFREDELRFYFVGDENGRYPSTVKYIRVADNVKLVNFLNTDKDLYVNVGDIIGVYGYKTLLGVTPVCKVIVLNDAKAGLTDGIMTKGDKQALNDVIANAAAAMTEAKGRLKVVNEAVNAGNVTEAGLYTNMTMGRPEATETYMLLCGNEAKTQMCIGNVSGKVWSRANKGEWKLLYNDVEQIVWNQDYTLVEFIRDYVLEPLLRFDDALDELKRGKADKTEVYAELGKKVNEAPADGKQYARKNGAWSEVVSADAIVLTANGGTVTSNKPLPQNYNNEPVYIKYITAIAQASVAFTGSYTITALMTQYAAKSVVQVRIHMQGKELSTAQVTVTDITDEINGKVDKETNKSLIDSRVAEVVHRLDSGEVYVKDSLYIDKDITVEGEIKDISGNTLSSKANKDEVYKKVDEAPQDGKQYARKNGAWSEVKGGMDAQYYKELYGGVVIDAPNTASVGGSGKYLVVGDDSPTYDGKNILTESEIDSTLDPDTADDQHAAGALVTAQKLSELEGIRGNLEELVKSYDMDVISSILDDLNGTSDINGQLDELNS